MKFTIEFDDSLLPAFHRWMAAENLAQSSNMPLEEMISRLLIQVAASEDLAAAQSRLEQELNDFKTKRIDEIRSEILTNTGSIIVRKEGAIDEPVRPNN